MATGYACQNRAYRKDSPTSGVLTVYTAVLPSQTQAYLKQFHAEYPNIKINLHFEPSSGVLLQRLLDERDAPQADVIWGLAATYLIMLEWHDVLSPYRPVGLEHIEPMFQDTNNPPYWVGFDAWMLGLCINLDELKKWNLPLPIAWSDLLHPSYKDRIILSNPLLKGTGFMMITSILQRYGETEGWDYLNTLHHNIRRYSADGEEPCDPVVNGELPIGISYGLQAIGHKAEHAYMEAVFPVGLLGWEMEASALVRKSEIKPAAKTFLDWAISPSAMLGYANNYAMIARTDVKATVPPGFPPEPRKLLFDRDFLWDAANRARIVNQLERRYAAKIPYRKP